MIHLASVQHVEAIHLDPKAVEVYQSSQFYWSEQTQRVPGEHAGLKETLTLLPNDQKSHFSGKCFRESRELGKTCLGSKRILR